MAPLTLAALTLVIVFVAMLLLSIAQGWRLGVLIAKPIAAAGFIAIALSVGAQDHAYGIAVLVALGLSWIGDVLLMSKEKPVFKIGILAFLLAHVAFGVAFLWLNPDILWIAGTLPVLGAIGIVVLRWLIPSADADFHRPIIAYVAVISTMVALAMGAWGGGASPFIAIGAIAFFASDLAVARERFVKSSIVNRLWGLPLYFGAQCILALSATSELAAAAAVAASGSGG